MRVLVFALRNLNDLAVYVNGDDDNNKEPVTKVDSSSSVITSLLHCYKEFIPQGIRSWSPSYIEDLCYKIIAKLSHLAAALEDFRTDVSLSSTM